MAIITTYYEIEDNGSIVVHVLDGRREYADNVHWANGMSHLLPHRLPLTLQPCIYGPYLRPVITSLWLRPQLPLPACTHRTCSRALPLPLPQYP